MEAHRYLSIQRASASQHRTSGALSSSLPVNLSSLEERYPCLPDCQLLSMQRELIAHPLGFPSSLPSNSGGVGPMFSSMSGFSNDLHFSSVGPPENYSRKSPFTSLLSIAGASMPLTPFHSTMFQSTPLNNSGSWFDPLPDFFDYPVNAPSKISQGGRSNEGGCPIPSEDHNKANDWQDWANLLINDDDHLASNWNGLFVGNVEEPQQKMAYQGMESSTNFLESHPQILQIPTSSGPSSCAVNSASSPSGTSTKQRMRWTPELHEAFADAVSKLGGSEKATPKGVLKLLKVEGLTIFHVKSHLQKYRTARYRPESSEESSGQNLASIQEVEHSDLKTGSEITEALRLQVELQKRLHEQLEVQRNLQLRIEEQGKYLQKMFENQCKGASVSSLENLSPRTRDAIPSSLDRNESGTSWVQNEESENAGVNESSVSVQLCRKLGEKRKVLENEAYEDLETDVIGWSCSPPSKQPRADEKTSLSRK